MTKYRLKSKLYGIPTFGLKNLYNGAKGLLAGTEGAGKMFGKGLLGVGATAGATYAGAKVLGTDKDAYTGNLGKTNGENY